MPPHYMEVDSAEEDGQEEEEERDGEQGSEGEAIDGGESSEEQEEDDGEGSSEDEYEDEDEYDEERENEDFAVREWRPSAQPRVSEVDAADAALVMANTPTCPVCMEPWTSQGAHRISCIPCGHVYGRSCLERWLIQHGNQSATCPQCDKRFEHKDIINLYAPEVAIPNSELEKEVSNLRERNIGYLKERDDFQEKKVQAQFNEMHAVVVENLKAHQDYVQGKFDQLHTAFEENMEAQHDYFVSYVAQYQATIQAKFKQLGIPIIPFPTFQPPRLVIPPWKHLLGPQVGISAKTDVSHSA